METRYVPELVMKRKVCKGCGDSTIEFSEVQRPYFCGECEPKFTK